MFDRSQIVRKVLKSMDYPHIFKISCPLRFIGFTIHQSRAKILGVCFPAIFFGSDVGMFLENTVL